MNSDYIESLNINGRIFKTAGGDWRAKIKEVWPEPDSSRLTYKILFLLEQSELSERVLKLRTYGEILLTEKGTDEIVRRVFDWLESEEGNGEISIYS